MKNVNPIRLTAPTPVQLHLPEFHRVALTLVGCGGTGSHLASGLLAIAGALAEKNIAMDLLFVDPDTVEEKNIGRQLFSAVDLGRPKAAVLAERLNLAFGARVGAAVRSIGETEMLTVPDREALNLAVGAVDNPAARALMTEHVKKAGGRLWYLDCGNENHSGQVALGNTTNARDLRGSVALGLIDRLPAPSLVYPDLVRTPKHKRERRKAPSCAELTAAGEQSLVINRMVAAWASSLLYDFLATRTLRYFALAVDLAWGGTRAYAIDLPTLAGVTGIKERDLVARGKEKGKR